MASRDLTNIHRKTFDDISKLSISLQSLAPTHFTIDYLGEHSVCELFNYNNFLYEVDKKRNSNGYNALINHSITVISVP